MTNRNDLLNASNFFFWHCVKASNFAPPLASNDKDKEKPIQSDCISITPSLKLKQLTTSRVYVRRAPSVTSLTTGGNASLFLRDMYQGLQMISLLRQTGCCVCC